MQNVDTAVCHTIVENLSRPIWGKKIKDLGFNTLMKIQWDQMLTISERLSSDFDSSGHR